MADDLQIGDYVWSDDRGLLHSQTARQPFPATTQAVFRLLIDHRDTDVRYETFSELWPGRSVESLKRLAHVRVSEIRVALTDSVHIETIPGTGYRLNWSSRRHNQRSSTRLLLSSEGASIATLKEQAWSHLIGSIRSRGRLKGWTQHLDANDVTAIGCAYGLRLGRLVSDGSVGKLARLSPVVDTVMRLRDKKLGLWTTNNKGAPVESTAWVIRGLSGWMPSSSLGSSIDAWTKLIKNDPAVEQHVSSLTLALGTLAVFRPSSITTRRLCQKLLPGNDAPTCWDRSSACNTEDGSPAHTAHAVLALLEVYEATEGKLGKGLTDLAHVRDWLLSQVGNLDNVTEDITRGQGRKRQPLQLKHYTAAWTTKALLSLGVAASDPRILSLVDHLLREGKGGLWRWNTSQKPIWATFDALDALADWWGRMTLSAEGATSGDQR